MASHRLLLCLLVVTVLQFANVRAGEICSQGQCCKDEETCCNDGCCHSQYPVCCSQNSQCCPSYISVCCSFGCCPSEYPHCCPPNGCCPSLYPVCCGTHCCPSGSTCCSAGCCDPLTERSTRSAPFFVANEGERMVRYTEAAGLDRAAEETHMVHYAETSRPNRAAHLVSSRSVLLSGVCNSYGREKLYEGYHTRVYLDSRGIRTIGVGFNLEKAGAQQQIEGVGADYDAVLNGRQDLTDWQIRTLFNQDMNTAVRCVTSWIPRWSLLGLAPQSALADMAFNLGCTKLMNFHCLWTALSRSPPDLNWAAIEMQNSDWCGQMGLRCDHDVTCIKPTEMQPNITIVQPESQLEKDLVEEFASTTYDEVNLEAVELPDGANIYSYTVTSRSPILFAFLITPQYNYLNGTVMDYTEGVDYFITATSHSISLDFVSVGVFVLSFNTKTSQENNVTVLSAGIRGDCDHKICRNGETCNNGDDGNTKNVFLTDIIPCPFNTECTIISQDVYVGQPYNRATVVRNCKQFIDEVLKKFESKGSKVNVDLNAHGGQGIFAIGEYNNESSIPDYDYVQKGSACYNEICQKLKDKIETLTLYSCKVAGGEKGRVFLKCLANCLNAKVKAWKNNVTADRRIPPIMWSTPRHFAEPLLVQPSTPGNTTEPSPEQSPDPPTDPPTEPTTEPTPEPSPKPSPAWSSHWTTLYTALTDRTLIPDY